MSFKPALYNPTRLMMDHLMVKLMLASYAYSNIAAGLFPKYESSHTSYSLTDALARWFNVGNLIHLMLSLVMFRGTLRCTRVSRRRQYQQNITKTETYCHFTENVTKTKDTESISATLEHSNTAQKDQNIQSILFIQLPQMSPHLFL